MIYDVGEEEEGMEVDLREAVEAAKKLSDWFDSSSTASGWPQRGTRPTDVL